MKQSDNRFYREADINTQTKEKIVPEIDFAPGKGDLAVQDASAQQVSVSASPDAAIFGIIERAARDPNVDIEKLERLLGMKERLDARAAEIDFFNAMASAQEEMEPVRKNAANPQTRSRYATHSALDEAIRPIYTKHGFAVSFNAEGSAPPDHLPLTCKVMHRRGHCDKHYLPMPADGKGAKGGEVMTRTHATGSAVTYGKRYLLGMAFNIAVAQDDDGNAAGQRYKEQPHRPGPAGSASAGTDFRPARRMPTSNWVGDAQNDGIVDQTRQKGTLPDKNGTTKPSMAAPELAKWCRDSIGAFGTIGTKPDLVQWWKDNRETREEAELKMPNEFERVLIAYDKRMDFLAAKGA